MSLAAMIAGIGFGNAGTHIPHACSYPIAGPEARLPAARLPDRSSLRAARPLGDRHRARRLPLHVRDEPGEAPSCGGTARGPPCRTPTRTRCRTSSSQLMKDIEAPRGIAELGYDDATFARSSRARRSSNACSSSPRVQPSARRSRGHPARLNGELVKHSARDEAHGNDTPRPLLILGTYMLAEERADQIGGSPSTGSPRFIKNYDRALTGAAGRAARLLG